MTVGDAAETATDRPIRRAVVLGAGVMGAQIAAVLAGAGIFCDLLDIVPAGATGDEANRLANEGIARLRTLKPSPLFSEDSLALVSPGNFEDDLERVRHADWVLEAVVERMEPKRALWARVESLLADGAIASTNTSGLPIREIAANFGPDLASRFMGTHFFNPPRYLPLVEVIPGPATDQAVVRRMSRFLSERLGKDVVAARDTPNFIANRLGTYGLQVIVEEMTARGLSIDDVDAVSGPAMGRPKSATFRTLDVVGLDTYVHVADNLLDRVKDEEERKVFRMPDAMRAMMDRGWFGQKSGQGFFRRIRDEGGSREDASRIETLNLATMKYEPSRRPQFASVAVALEQPDPAIRIATLLHGDDEAAAFAWAATSRLLAYAARILPEIADDAGSVDRAMRGGFGWALGPFELWDALGFRETAARMKADGLKLPDWVQDRITRGATSVLDGQGRLHGDVSQGSGA